MAIINKSDWQLDEEHFGVSLDGFVHVEVPSAAFGSSAVRRVQDFYGEIDGDGNEVVKLIPFEEVKRVVHSGDVFIFMDQKLAVDHRTLLRQRGWHTEMVYLKDGEAWQVGPWRTAEGIKPLRCEDLHEHAHFSAENKNFIEHIFRFMPNTGAISESLLSRQLVGWSKIFENYIFPDPSKTYNEYYLDPGGAFTIEELIGNGCELIRKSFVEPVTCAQWVHLVMALAMNFPLSREFLQGKNMAEIFDKEWHAQGVDYVEHFAPAECLPYLPYSPARIVQACVDTYFAGKNILEGELIRCFRNKINEALKMPDADRQVLEEYFDEVIRSKNIDMPLISPRSGTRYRYIMPIVPMLEARKKERSTMGTWKYVATAMYRNFLKKEA